MHANFNRRCQIISPEHCCNSWFYQRRVRVSGFIYSRQPLFFICPNFMSLEKGGYLRFCFISSLSHPVEILLDPLLIFLLDFFVFFLPSWGSSHLGIFTFHLPCVFQGLFRHRSLGSLLVLSQETKYPSSCHGRMRPICWILGYLVPLSISSSTGKVLAKWGDE